MKTVKS